MTIEKLRKKCEYFHQLQEPNFLYKELSRIDNPALMELKPLWKPEKEFYPVNLLRYIILQRLLKSEPVTQEVIEAIKLAIENRDVSTYLWLTNDYFEKLKNYKNSPKGMYPNWKNPFSILYPFFYYGNEKIEIIQQLSGLGEQIIKQFNLSDAKVHFVGLDGSQNYGASRMWGAVIPQKADNIQKAYQLFFEINNKNILGGLYKGHKLKNKDFERISQAFSTWDNCLANFENLIPKWQQLNSKVDFSFQIDEKNFLKRIKKSNKTELNYFFTFLDYFNQKLTLPDEGNLVFSISSSLISFQVGRRYCLSLKKDHFSFIAPEGYEINGLDKSKFSGRDNARYYQNTTYKDVNSNIEAILNAIDIELNRNNETELKDYDNSAFRRAVFDFDYRLKLFDFKSQKLIMTNQNINNNELNHIALNQILFGPPGTGKTYSTINKALELCGENLNDLSRSDIKDKFEKKVEDGQVVFTTFHQSMSYEDFIEGIKPIEPEKEGDPVIYRVVEGIFRKLCIEASFAIAKENEFVETENVLDFSLAFDDFTHSLEERLTSEDKVELVTKNGGKILVDSISAKGNIIVKHKEGSICYTVSKSRLSKIHKSISNLKEIDNINRLFREIIGGHNSSAYWAVLNALRQRSKPTINKISKKRSYTWEEKKETVQSLKKEDFKGKKGKPFVLIIDEINRGNVSQIFGELITLIEKDKRLGKKEALDVQLPYSKDRFGVPPNLYILGTMNTADRSVEALDTALRRRFSFVEMPPKPELIKITGKEGLNDINLVELLKTINKRIEKLLDKDHMIGHSYFLSLTDLNSLKLVFQNKIIPLLQEYFFGDYGKVGLVIGSSFFIEEEQEDIDDNFFAPFEEYDSSSLIEKKVYRIREVIKMKDEEFIAAINFLLRKSN